MERSTYSLALQSVEIDTDPDQQALDAAPDPDKMMTIRLCPNPQLCLYRIFARGSGSRPKLFPENVVLWNAGFEFNLGHYQSSHATLNSFYRVQSLQG